MSSIKVIRLISGEELMGEVKLEDGIYELKNVCQLATSYSDPTTATARIGLAPFMPYTDAKDCINMSVDFVAFVVDPVVDLVNEYNKIFGAGIVIPSTNKPIKSGSSAFVKI